MRIKWNSKTFTPNNLKTATTLNALIIDDEYQPGKHLELLIEQHCDAITGIRIIRDTSEGLLHLQKETVDVVFLDIEMPQMNAFQFIEIIRPEKMPPVIFTTSHSQYAIEAFKVNALDYLLKPIDPEELKRAVSRISEQGVSRQQEKLESVMKLPPIKDQERIVLVSGSVHHLVHYNEIIRVEGSGSYSEFHLMNDRHVLVSKPLVAFREGLLTKGFIRPHQSHLVNRAFITGFDRAEGGFLLMKEGKSVPVSSRLRKSVLDELNMA